MNANTAYCDVVFYSDVQLFHLSQGKAWSTYLNMARVGSSRDQLTGDSSWLLRLVTDQLFSNGHYGTRP